MIENSCLEVIVGTYEELLVGYQVKKEDNKYVLLQSFTNHSHCGSIRSVASRNRYLASGSSDETIKLFNLKSRTEMGIIVQQEGSVNCLQFFDDHHLFSGSEDGTICIWKTGGWNCLKTLKDHRGGVTSFCVHPSGKLALSVSKDRTLKTWNLVKGRAAFTTHIKSVGDLVQWSPGGKTYAVVIGNRVDVYDVETAAIVHTIDFGRRINAVVFITDKMMAIGGEGGNIEFHAANKKAILCVLPTKTTRVKALNCVVSPDSEAENWLISSSSDGFVKLWKFDPLTISTEQPELLAQVGTGCRITCQTVIVSDANEGKQRDRGDVEKESDEDVKESNEEDNEESGTPKTAAKKRKITKQKQNKKKVTKK